jgi:hypothetical protein
MTSETMPAPPPTVSRVVPAHLGAAGLSLVGAFVLQMAWPEIVGRSPQTSWWPRDALVLAAATAYLLATAWLHVRALPGEWTRAIFADLAVGVCAAAMFYVGPESRTIQAGLWLLPSVLLTSGVASAAVAGFAIWDGRGRLANGSAVNRIGWIHALLAIALIIAVVWLERHEPTARPWEPSNPSAVNERAYIPLTTVNCAAEPAGFVSSTLSSGSARSETSTRNVSVCLPAENCRSMGD